MRLRFIVAVGGALLVNACAAQEEAAKKERPPKRVQVELVQSDDLTDILTLPATVEAREATTLATGRAGRVGAITADEGDRVSKGQVLIRINAIAAFAELKQAKAAHASAKATYGRTQELGQRNLASDSQLETANAALAQAEAALEMARANVEYAVLRAPHSGYIADRKISVGEYASPGVPLLELVDIDTVKLIAKVPERDVDSLELGSEARFKVDALASEVLRGTIDRIGVVADPAARTFEVEVRVKNRDRRLKPGMLARLELPRRSLSNVPVIRRDAVVEDLDGPTVFVARNGKAERVRVSLGPVNGDLVAISDGLEPGMPLIVVGQRMLVEGEPIKIIGDPVETAKLPDTSEPAAGGQVVVAEE